MNCQDCYYCELCSFWKSVGGIEKHFSNGGCGYFKDKSKIIELPCKIGDMVYIISPVGHVLTRKFAGIHISTVISRAGKRIDYIITKNSLGSDRHDVRKIGKSIFFSKVDAENKLKGGKI